LWKNKEVSLSNSEVTLSFGLFESREIGDAGDCGASVCGIGGTMWLGFGGRAGGGEGGGGDSAMVVVIDI